MAPFICAGAGFLLAVLWFDLMFDVQVARSGSAERTEEAVGSIASYYRRVTTDARPMNRLVAAVMLATLASIIVQIARGDHPRWVGWVALALAGFPVLLAGAHTVPSAVRLGSREDPTGRQHELARSILRDHVFCATAIAALIVIELSFA
jgi:peptidoglycan/LPS O-acetylase OafA/YrhL